MGIVTIQGPENIVELSAGSTDNQQFVVKNSSGEKLRIGMRAESEDRQVTDWLDIAGPDEIDLEENTVTEIKVNIAVPAKAKSGRHNYRLVVFDANNTSRCGQSDAVYFDVKEKETEEKKTNIPYIIGAIAGVLVLVGVIHHFTNSQDVKLTETSLIDNVIGNDLPEVEKCLTQGVDVNARDKDNNMTALMYATMLGEKPIVEKLLKKGADVNATDKDGRTALMFATIEANPKKPNIATFKLQYLRDIVQALLDKGADVNATDKHGINAWMWAKYNAYKDLIELLKKNKATESKAKIFYEDGSYEYTENGIAYVYDVKAGLQWAAIKTKDTSWSDMAAIILKIQGYGWKFPTQEQLLGLLDNKSLDKLKDKINDDNLFKDLKQEPRTDLTMFNVLFSKVQGKGGGYGIWSGENNTEIKECWMLHRDIIHSRYRSYKSNHMRGLAVRSK